nr:MAG TPA: hypothetical protein [Caudoviricetes sp.]
MSEHVPLTRHVLGEQIPNIVSLFLSLHLAAFPISQMLTSLVLHL